MELSALFLKKKEVLYPGSPVQPVLHDTNELFVGQLVIVIDIEDLEDGVYKVTCQLEPCGHIHRSGKLIYQGRK